MLHVFVKWLHSNEQTNMALRGEVKFSDGAGDSDILHADFEDSDHTEIESFMPQLETNVDSLILGSCDELLNLFRDHVSQFTETLKQPQVQEQISNCVQVSFSQTQTDEIPKPTVKSVCTQTHKEFDPDTLCSSEEEVKKAKFETQVLKDHFRELEQDLRRELCERMIMTEKATKDLEEARHELALLRVSSDTANQNEETDSDEGNYLEPRSPSNCRAANSNAWNMPHPDHNAANQQWGSATLNFSGPLPMPTLSQGTGGCQSVPPLLDCGIGPAYEMAMPPPPHLGCHYGPQLHGYHGHYELPEVDTYGKSLLPEGNRYGNTPLPEVNTYGNSLLPQGYTYGNSALPRGNTYGYSALPQGNTYGYSALPQGNTYGNSALPQGNTFGNSALPQSDTYCNSPKPGYIEVRTIPSYYNSEPRGQVRFSQEEIKYI